MCAAIVARMLEEAGAAPSDPCPVSCLAKDPDLPSREVVPIRDSAVSDVDSFPTLDAAAAAGRRGRHAGQPTSRSAKAS